MSELSERIAGLSPEKRKLLERLLKKEGVASSRLPITPQPRRSNSFPLSFAQQRLWFLDQLEPGNPFYNIFDAFTFMGAFEMAAMEQAVVEILKRHEILRATISTANGEPAQAIAPALVLPLPLVDVRALPRQAREQEASRLCAEQSKQPFDLSSGPLVRMLILRLSDDEHLLLLTMHHIIADAWSLEVFEKELRALYEGFCAGEDVKLPPLPIQYADFSVWQRQWLQGDVLQNQLDYWKQHLAGAPAVLEFPTDRPRPPVQTYRGARQWLTISKEKTESLRSLSMQEGTTLFMTLLAAFKVLLYRYSGQDDIIIGLPVAGRNRVEVEGLIGFFINTLALRTDVSGEPSFRELLRRVKKNALEAYAHQDLPFEKLVEELRLERDMSRNPLFQITFQLVNVSDSVEGALSSPPTQAKSVEDASEFSLDAQNGSAKFDMALDVWEGDGALSGRMDYSTDLFDEATITRMLGHFQVLLESVIANPDQRVSQLPILPAQERDELLVRWNDTESDFPRHSSIHEIFEMQVEHAPDALAVAYGDECFTYSALNSRANQLARRLRSKGVGPDVLVGIFMERSARLVMSLLAILKAGGAYVPLDPEYPQERLSLMMEDADIPVLITEKRLVEMLPYTRASILSVDEDPEGIVQEDSRNLGRVTTSDNLAYIVYTSGSTGVPKGVCVIHRAVVRLVCDTDYVRLDASDKIAQVSNSCFDAATFEIFGALLNGALLVGVSTETLLSAKDFAAQIREQQITAMFLTTALFNQLVSEAPAMFSALDHLLTGGDVADVKKIDEVLKQGPPGELLHVYGPTESTTFASCYLVSSIPDNAATVPIGSPIRNTQTYLLDHHLQPVPVGVPGELHLGGHGLARGYLNSHDLTAEKFIPHPFSEAPGARLYKTGDKCRYLQNGEIDFLARFDGQVKIRGFRVELREIEWVLSKCPGVEEVAVLALGSRAEEKRLVGYVVADKNRTPLMNELQDFVRGKLPEYMIPSAFVYLESLPLSSNGKLDRKALPAPGPARPELEKAFMAPRTPTEETLAGIWAEVLRLEQVGVYDNFFHLGGHSLLATQIVSRVRKAFQLEISLRAIFESPTIALLAKQIDNMAQEAISTQPRQIVKTSRERYRIRI